MVARKLSSYDTTVSLENFAKQRPSIYIDPESNLHEELLYLQNIADRDNIIKCIKRWRFTSTNKEGK